MIPGSERTKTVHALHRSATVTGYILPLPVGNISEGTSNIDRQL
jgi:hypothetical protein